MIECASLEKGHKRAKAVLREHLKQQKAEQRKHHARPTVEVHASVTLAQAKAHTQVLMLSIDQ